MPKARGRGLHGRKEIGLLVKARDDFSFPPFFHFLFIFIFYFVFYLKYPNYNLNSGLSFIFKNKCTNKSTPA
jgi:hypothetical protein